MIVFILDDCCPPLASTSFAELRYTNERGLNECALNTYNYSNVRRSEAGMVVQFDFDRAGRNRGTYIRIAPVRSPRGFEL